MHYIDSGRIVAHLRSIYHSYPPSGQGCCKLPFCRLRRWEGRMKRGHLALRHRAVALCTPTSTHRLPNLATALSKWSNSMVYDEHDYLYLSHTDLCPQHLSTEH